jgi:GGDEF domain-containing protein
VSTTMTGDQGSANGAHGGVGHLLRMAKTQCGGSLAFAALRKPDGGFAIATFPTLTAEPTWTIESVDELVRQTWEDPHLTGGTVLVRSARVLRSMWTGQGHHIKLAVAALSDPDAPQHPWGLLCVAEPLAGHFEQDQLKLLAALAGRLTSYLRARQRVLEGGLSAPEDLARAATPPQTPEPPVEAPPEARPPTSGQSWAEGLEALERVEGGGPAVTEAGIEQVEHDEHPLEAAAELLEPAAPWGHQPGRQSRVDDWEFLGLDQIEWVEALTPPPPPDEAEGAAAPFAPGWTAPAAQASTPPEPSAPIEPVAQGGTAGPEGRPGAAQDLDALLAPDPETGLASLTTLVGRLGTALARAANHEGTVGLILVEVMPSDARQALGPSALMTVAGRLTNRLRDRDLVARIGPNLFAVVVDLRPEVTELEAIRARIAEALAAGVDPSSGVLAVRTALAVAAAGSTETAESLLRRAADELRGP